MKVHKHTQGAEMKINEVTRVKTHVPSISLSFSGDLAELLGPVVY